MRRATMVHRRCTPLGVLFRLALTALFAVQVFALLKVLG
jgi:hypothetical protein